MKFCQTFAVVSDKFFFLFGKGMGELQNFAIIIIIIVFVGLHGVLS